MESNRQRWTLEAICQIEPGIEQLRKEIMMEQGRPGYCANSRWYGYGEHRGEGFKRRFVRLVGRGAERRELSSSEAYDAAYHPLYDALPDCQHGNATCGMLDSKGRQLVE